MWHFRCKNCGQKVPEQCQVCETGRFLADCKAAVDLIDWYEHEYHEADLDHEQMIVRLKMVAQEVEQLGTIAPRHLQVLGEVERRVDGWLYQVI